MLDRENAVKLCCTSVVETEPLGESDNHFPVGRMKAIEIWRNGEKMATAGLVDGIVTAKLTIRNQSDPIWFDARGRDASSGGHKEWLHESARIGDNFELRLVDVEL